MVNHRASTPAAIAIESWQACNDGWIRALEHLFPADFLDVTPETVADYIRDLQKNVALELKGEENGGVY